MKIAIEAQRIFRLNKHGMDFVALELIRELQRLDKDNEYYILVAGGDDKCLTSSSNFHVIELRCPSYVLWEQFALPFALNKIKPDVVHCTSNTAPLFCPYPLVLTLHDVIFMEKKIGNNASAYQNLGRIYRRWVVPHVVRKARKIITVSHYEHNQIKETLQLDSDKLVTVYNGVGQKFQPVSDFSYIIRKYIPCDNYIFLLGNTDPKKNIYRALCGYAIYARQTEKPRPLLIADIDREYLYTLLDIGNMRDISTLLYTPGYISNKDLPVIYSGAFIFLYPSLRESFGLPILEAMACGTPVITSLKSAIPEVAGDEAAFINPENVDEISEMILKFENNSDFYNSQVEYGFKRAEIFSWKNTALGVRKLYNEITYGRPCE